MEQSTRVKTAEKRVSEPYSEPLLIKHEPLRDITGAKYGEKEGTEKAGLEAGGGVGGVG
jgi:hypothetical protein